MDTQRYVVMGAGEVGFHLAVSLSKEGHQVSVIEINPAKLERLEEEADVQGILGNGAHLHVLEASGTETCDLFLAVSSSDEANLSAALMAKKIGAARSVVRVGVAEEVINHRDLYEEVFRADMLLSTELLGTARVLDAIRGHNTLAVEYLAGGRVQLERIHLDDSSPLTRHPLREVQMPEGSLVVAFFRGDELIIPGGDDRAEPGDDTLILGKIDVINQAEQMVSSGRDVRGTVVLAGGGSTGSAVARALEPLNLRVKIIERDRRRAGELATLFPRYEILHGDATDMSLLKAEHISRAQTFVALSGNDESNLMACLLVQELGVPQVLAQVDRTETFQLWRRQGLHNVFSPRALAYDRIREYIDTGYSANIVSLQKGAALVMERRLAAASPAAGVTLAEMKPPRGLIVGAVVRRDRVFVPRGPDRLEADDLVILFVHEDELDTANLLFPGRTES